jgi:hypothetical protein
MSQVLRQILKMQTLKEKKENREMPEEELNILPNL